MAQQKKQVTTTGSGVSNTPILASAQRDMEGQFLPSQTRTSIEQGNTKPVSPAEALSLLQTICFDLQSLGFKVSILVKDNRLYTRITPDTGKLGVRDGHITLNGAPVSVGDE